MNIRSAARVAAFTLCCATLAAVAPQVAAQDRIDKPVKLLVGFPPGGTADLIARVVADKMKDSLGQPVIVENRPGASGTIAADLVARAVPDGHTLLLAGVTQTIQPGIPGANAVDPTTAFAPIIKLTTQPVLLAAHHDFPATRLADVVALARREPGTIAYSTAGVGSSGHVAAAMFTAAAQIELLHVPYATTNAIWRDAVAGLVPLTFNPVSGALPHLGAGKLRPVAVTGSRRSRALPETPTFAESGYPGVDIHSWYGILAPAGTPPETVARLHAALAGILRQPDVRARFTDFGLEIAGTPPGPMAAEIKAEVARWRPIIRALGLDAAGEAGRPAPAR